MGARDLVGLAWGSIVAHRLRSTLTVLGIVIGIGSVILLTSLGEGTRRFILAEFTQFGTHLLSVTPGRFETTGIPGALGATTRPLTIEDAEALRRVPGVTAVVPVATGMARVEAGGLGRSVMVLGVTAEAPAMWGFAVRQGAFLPPGDPRRRSSVAVLGPKLKREIFGDRNPLGEHVRIGGRRFLVIGVMAPKGQFLGFDLDDTAYVPVASAQTLFNRPELMEIDVTYRERMPVARVVEGVRRALVERHDREDFTITSQAEMLAVLDRVLGIVNLAVSAIGAISLVVGAIGILTMMWISVNERTREIGLEKAVGASPRQLLRLFLVEAALLSLAGGAIGIAGGLAIARLVRVALPGLPFHLPVGYAVAALGVSLAVGLASGALPARRAAALDPLEALRAE